MSNDMKTLTQQRSSIKGRVTNFSNFLESLKLIEPKKISKLICSELQLKLDRLRELFSSFDEIQNNIECIADNLEAQLAEREKIETSFCSLIAAAQNLIETVQEASGDTNTVSDSCSHNHNVNIKLPTINLPTFDGNYLHWLEFRDTFESLINKSTMIPPINKFHYLRNSLKGAAAVVIQSIEFSAENYKLTWDLLCERFNNKRILINNHLKALFQFEPIQRESYKALRYMVDCYSKNLRALDNLEEPTEYWDTLIIFIMTSKLDSAAVRKWEEHRGESGKSPDLNEFFQFIRSRADFLETLQLSKNDNDKSEKQNAKENKNTKSFLSSSSTNPIYKSCVVCEQSHSLHECDKFKEMSVEDRISTVNQHKFCINCLRPNHHHSKCRLGPCRICKRKHNSLLHRNNIKNNNNSTSSNSPGSGAAAATASGSTAPISLSATMSSQVLLCTAEVEVIDLKTNNTYLAKALLDSGSQSSFLSEKAKNKMNLKSIATQVSISGINNTTSSSTQICDIKLKSRVNSFSIMVSCLVIPQITNNIPSVEVDTTQIILPSNVTLADPTFSRPSEVHILLGADVFWDIVETNQIKLGRNKPTLQSSKLGWLVAGPTGYSLNKQHNLQCNFSLNVTLPETMVSLNIQSEKSFVPFDRFSKLSKLERVFASVLRFINNCKRAAQPIKGELTKDELQTSLFTLAKLSQQESFLKDINNLTHNKALHRKSNILSLNPFIDDQGILRVGGRIQNASHCPYGKVHPILINSSHPFSKLLFSREHLRLFHCGPQQLLCSVRESFWPTGGRILARATVNKCFVCSRLKPKSIQPIMGDLPKSRVTPAPPFEHCGTDFAGPFYILNRKGRGARTSKCYLCLFVCFSTKALHLEIVSDLTANAFILCLRRFISRRGKPRVICCDNGKNFVGADRELARMLRTCNQSVDEFSREEGVEFKFNPAYSPSFGGIWEAGVKSAKFHLKRIASNSNLTFEELSTLFAQIEAILNSRPLTPLSADPSDLNPLTPGHFLIGRPLTSLPSPATEKLTLNRYHIIERLRQHFWTRWTKEYLSELQKRVKWRTNQEGYEVGDLVVIKEDHLPPMKWIIGRIAQRYPGADQVCRVVDIQTPKGIVRRALTKVCPLLPRNSHEPLES